MILHKLVNQYLVYVISFSPILGLLFLVNRLSNIVGFTILFVVIGFAPWIIELTKKLAIKFNSIKEINSTESSIFLISKFGIAFMVALGGWSSLFTDIGKSFDTWKYFYSIFSIMFILFGFQFPRIKPNLVIGIRTPWTIENDKVWKKTHIFAGKFLIITGLFMLFVAFFTKISFEISGLVFIFLLIALSILSLIYSFIQYKKIKDEHSPN